MNFLSVFSGCGGFDLGFEKAGLKCVGQIENMPYALKVLKNHWPKIPKHTDILTFCVEDGLVRTIQLQTAGRVKAMMGKKAVSGKSLEDSSNYSALNGLSGKMFPDFSLSMLDGTSGKSFPTSIHSGIVWHGMCWTLKTLDWHNGEKECSLSEVLETSVPQKFYLSKKAVAGMIRRSERYGRGAYVFLLEAENGKTPRLTRMSLTSFKQAITGKLNMENSEMKGTLFARQSKVLTKNFASSVSEKTSSVKRLEIVEEDLLPLYGKILMLRKLTPTEKEKLQGFPKIFTLCEG